MTEQNVANPKIEIEVDFGNVSIGEDVARIGVEIDRERLKLNEADQFFSGSRLKVGLMATPKGELKGQKHFDDMTETIESEVDCKSFSVQADKFKTGLKFNAQAIKLLTLVSFRKRPGKLFVEWIGDASTHDDEDGFDPDEREFEAGKDRPHGQPALKAAAQGALKLLSGGETDPAKLSDLNMLTKANLKKLAKQNNAEYDDQGLSDLKVGAIKESFDIKTIPQLENIINTDPFWHQKINRFGEAAIDLTTDALLLFRKLVGYQSDDSATEGDDSESTPPGYLDANVPDEEVISLGMNASVADEGQEEKTKNPFPPGTRANEVWQRSYDRVEAEGTAEQGDDDSDTMFDEEHSEEIEDDPEDTEGISEE